MFMLLLFVVVAAASSQGVYDDAVTALPAGEAAPGRTLVEFCTSDNSKLGQRTPRGCKVVRLTLSDDLTTEAGMERARKEVQAANDDGEGLLYGSLPCIAGCPWGNVNIKKPGGKSRLRKQRKIFKKLLANWLRLGRLNQSLGGAHAFEWPKHCSLWKEVAVEQMRAELGLEDVVFDGCAVGLEAQHGALVLTVRRCAASPPRPLAPHPSCRPSSATSSSQ